jgi:hypothetical protein
MTPALAAIRCQEVRQHCRDVLERAELAFSASMVEENIEAVPLHSEALE